jgi:hypothetical protein
VAASSVEHDNGDAASGDQGDPGEGQSIRQRTPNDQASHDAPKREAVEEGRDGGGSPEPIGEQEPDVPEGEEKTGEA